MTLFRLDASIRTDGSVSRAVADTVEQHWRTAHPDAAVVRRDIGAEPLAGDAWAAGIRAAQAAPGTEPSAAGRDSLALSARLADELVDARAYVFASPLYNFGVPGNLKNWIDLVINDPRMGPYGDRPLTGRPAVLVVSRGGGYGPGTPREGWDHATPYLRRVLTDVWGLDLRVAEAELTLAPVNPAMADLVGLFEQSLREAHDSAADHGRHLGRLVAA